MNQDLEVAQKVGNYYGVYRVARGEFGGQFYKLVYATTDQYKAQRFRHEKYYRYGDTGLGFFRNRELSNVPRFLKLQDPRIIG